MSCYERLLFSDYSLAWLLARVTHKKKKKVCHPSAASHSPQTVINQNDNMQISHLQCPNGRSASSWVVISVAFLREGVFLKKQLDLKCFHSDRGIWNWVPRPLVSEKSSVSRFSLYLWDACVSSQMSSTYILYPSTKIKQK